MKKILTTIFTFIIVIVLSFYSGSLQDPEVITKETIKIEQVASPPETIIVPIENIVVQRETLRISKTDTLYRNWLDTIGLVLLADTLARDLVQNLDYFKYTQFNDIKPDMVPGFQGAKIWSTSSFTMIDNQGIFRIEPIPQLNMIRLEAYPGKVVYKAYPFWKKMSYFSAGFGAGYVGLKITKNF